jgi:3(or 17)beta-hydroxysteroid dehydrogenase
MGRMDGKRVIVTGSASGLGRATVTQLLGEGAAVVATDIDAEGGRALADELGEACIFVTHDVSEEPDWVRVVGVAQERLGGIDALVNNAGIVKLATVEDTSLEDWHRVLRVNLDGVFLGCKHVIPAMAASGGGSIVNLSSVAAMAGQPAFAAYAASKGGVRSLTKTVAVHCAQRGQAIRCNSIHPGGIDTPMTQALPAALADASAIAVEALTSSGLGRVTLGAPEDVANLVLFLVSDESRHMTGAELVLDGGQTAG